jgi:serine/threonine protein kinase
MAEIFRGSATAGGGFVKPVAIKRILPHLSQDKRFVELLITEAKTLSQLRHRNVVQIYDVGLGDDGQYFLVMEYVDGIDLGRLYESLEQRMRRLPLDVALYITGEVCEALEHAHQARGSDGQPLGLVHRDVSPSNVLLSRSGEVKLTDFGIAKRTEEATGHGGVRGKFAYISPEQAHNRRVDARSDVYSIAILLFELVTGHRLFSDLPDFDALRAVREGRLPRPRDIDPSIDSDLERILLTGLAPRPEDRFPSAGNLGAELRTCRYSLVSSLGDPAVEISRLVDEHAATNNKDHSAPTREPSVVRISTVAGFSGTFEVPEDPAEEPTGTITGELSAPPGMGLDEEEETRAVKLSSVGPLLTSPAAMDDLGAAPRSERSKPLPPELAEVEALAEAETRVLDYRPDLFPELAGSDHANAVEAISHRESAGPHKSPAPELVAGSDVQQRGALGAGSDVQRVPLGPGSDSQARPVAPGSGSDVQSRAAALAPTIRQVFYTGRRAEDPRRSSPTASAVPILDSQASSARRRTLLLASGAAGGLAVLTFLIAGAFMGSGEETAQSPFPPRDAASPGPVDGATPPGPRDATAPPSPRDATAPPSKRDASAPRPRDAAPPPMPAPVPDTTTAAPAVERPKRKRKKAAKKRDRKPSSAKASSDKKRGASSKR